MLKLRYLYENFELAKCALENWECDAESIDEYFKYFRISSNAVYPFALGGERRFLRLSPVEEKIEANLRGELEFLAYLRGRDYPCAAPIPAKNGETLLKLDTRWGGYYACVFADVGGVSVEDTDLGDDIMFACGRALGRLHCLSADFEPKCRKWEFDGALAWAEEVLREYAAPEKMLAEAGSVGAELARLPRNRESYGLVHYDFEPDNVFWHEESGVCASIDYEDGMYHFFLLDVEQALDAIGDCLSGDALARGKERFLSGYRTEKALDPDFQDQLKLMRRFCNIFSYARLIRCVAEKQPDEPDWMIGLREKLNRRIASLEQGVQ